MSIFELASPITAASISAFCFALTCSGVRSSGISSSSSSSSTSAWSLGVTTFPGVIGGRAGRLVTSTVFSSGVAARLNAVAR